jgi:hypothetical protein
VNSGSHKSRKCLYCLSKRTLDCGGTLPLFAFAEEKYQIRTSKPVDENCWFTQKIILKIY